MTDENVEISEQIMEIRFKANPIILDYRGSWAETISKLMDLPHWKIDSNRIDIYDNDNLRKAFVSFKNFGVIINNSPTYNYFPEQANRLVRYLFEQEPFGKSIFIERIGVRSRFGIKYDGEFNELLKCCLSNIININSNFNQIIDGEITDLGGSFTFSTDKGFLNTNNGPMKSEQLKEFFPYFKNIPDVAYYIDLDYWKIPEKVMDKTELTRIVKEFSEENWNNHEKMISLLCNSQS